MREVTLDQRNRISRRAPMPSAGHGLSNTCVMRRTRNNVAQASVRMDGSRPLFAATAMLSHHVCEPRRTSVAGSYEDTVKRILNIRDLRTLRWPRMNCFRYTVTD